MVWVIMSPTPESIDSIEPSANDKPAARTPENVINNKKSYSNQAFNDDELNNGIHAAQHIKVTDAVNNASDHLDFDDILPHVGEFGRYQKILFFLMIPFAFFVAFVYFTQIFMTLVPERHWCRIPELDHLPVDQRWVWKLKNGMCPCANALDTYVVVLFCAPQRVL